MPLDTGRPAARGSVGRSTALAGLPGPKSQGWEGSVRPWATKSPSVSHLPPLNVNLLEEMAALGQCSVSTGNHQGHTLSPFV